MMKLALPSRAPDLDGVAVSRDLGFVISAGFIMKPAIPDLVIRGERQRLLDRIGASFIMKLFLVRHAVRDDFDGCFPLFGAARRTAAEEAPDGFDDPVLGVRRRRASPPG